MKRNFGAIIIATVIAIIIIAMNWFFYGKPELTNSESFLLIVAGTALIIALQNSILREEESK